MEYKTKKIPRIKSQYEPFVYLIKNTVTGKMYIGSRTAKECKIQDLGSKYFTSSKLIKCEWRAGDRLTKEKYNFKNWKSRNKHSLLGFFEYLLEIRKIGDK